MSGAEAFQAESLRMLLAFDPGFGSLEALQHTWVTDEDEPRIVTLKGRPLDPDIILVDVVGETRWLMACGNQMFDGCLILKRGEDGKRIRVLRARAAQQEEG